MNDIILVSQVPFGRVVDANAFALQQLDFTREQLAALTVYELVDEATARLLSDKFFSGPGSVDDRETVTGSMRNRQGELNPVEMMLCRVRLPGSAYVVVMARDLKRFKTTEEALMESEARHRMIIYAAFDGVVTMDEHGQIIGWNPQAEKMFGWTQQEVIGTPLADTIIPAEQRAAHREGLERYLASGEGPLLNKRVELTALRRNGHEFPVELTITPLSLGSSTIFNAFIRDITALKESKEALQRAHAELEHRVEERTADLIESNRQLKEAEAKYRTLVEQLPAITYIAEFGRNGAWLYVSPQIESLIGFSPAEWTADRELWFRHVHPDDRERVLREETESQSSGSPLTTEYRMVSRAGSLIWVRDAASVVRNEQGAPAFLHGVMMDITRQRQAEEELARARQRYHDLVDNINVGVFRNTPGPFGQFLEVNPAMIGMFEAGSQEEILQHPVSDFYLHPEQRRQFSEKMVAHGFVRNEELQLKTLKGRTFWASVTAVKKEEQGQVYFYGMVEDIAERKRVEEQLRLQASALEAAANGILITDRKGVVLWVNSAFTTLTGYTLLEAVGQSTRLLKSGQQSPAFYKRLWSTIQAGRVWRGEIVNARKDGSFYTEDMTITPVRNAEGEVVNYIAIKQDVSKRKRAERIESAMYRIAETAGSTEDIASFCASIHAILGDLLYARNFYLALLDAAGAAVSFPYFVDEKDPVAASRPLRRSLTDYVITRGQSFWMGQSGAMEQLDKDGFQMEGSVPVDWIGVPLQLEGKTFGMLAVQSYDPVIRYTDRDVDLLMYVSQQIAVAIERKRAQVALNEYARQLRIQNEQMADDLNMAREIQQALLPSKYPCFPASASMEQSVLRFNHLYDPSGVVGGDFFDILPLSDTRAGVFICDVMGHGMRAALVTAILRGLTEELTLVAHEPGAFLSELNEGFMAVFRYSEREVFASALYLVVDVATGQLLYANAGHPSPFRVRRRRDQVEPLAIRPEERGPALGLFDNASYTTCQSTVDADELLILFTDGICEVEGPGRDPFGEERFLEAVRRRLHHPPDTLFKDVLEEARQYSGGQGFPDDVCLLGIEVIRLLRPEDRDQTLAVSR
jgi:PAS domain S-box-containing protein